jgi:hypothetical protein
VPCEYLYHRYVHRRTEQLTGGHTYHYQMRNVRPVFILQSWAPDSVMYLVDKNNEIVARNNDYGYWEGGPGPIYRSSEIIYRPEQSGIYTLILRSWTYLSPGYCDLYRAVHPDWPEPSLKLLEKDVLFWGGGTRHVRYRPGTVFETTNSTGDPYLIFMTSDNEYASVYFGSGIDDAGAGLNSRFVVPNFDWWQPDTEPQLGTVILGSFSPSSQGECDFCHDDPSALAPQRVRRENIQRSHEMQQFAAQLIDTKDTLEDLEPAERERKVAELQQKILSKDERRLRFMPPPEPPPELVRSYEEYRRLSKELDQEREGSLNSEQFQRLQELETRMLEA